MPIRTCVSFPNVRRQFQTTTKRTWGVSHGSGSLYNSSVRWPCAVRLPLQKARPQSVPGELIRALKTASELVTMIDCEMTSDSLSIADSS